MSEYFRRQNGSSAFAEEAPQDVGRVQYPSFPLCPADMKHACRGLVLPGAAGLFPCFLLFGSRTSGREPAGPRGLAFGTVVEPCHRPVRLLMRRPYG